MYIQPENDGAVQSTQDEAPSPTESDGGDHSDTALEVSIMISGNVFVSCVDWIIAHAIIEEKTKN